MAKLFNIKVNEFSVGMGPVIWKKSGKETFYSLRALPIGGFCRMEGEDTKSNDERSFSEAAWYKRFIVVSAGAVLNIILGFVIFVIICASSPTAYQPVIDSITPQTGLDGSIFEAGDRIVMVGGSRIHIYDDLSFTMQRITDSPIEVTAVRGGKKITDTIQPSKQEITYIYEEDYLTFISSINGIKESEEKIPAPDTDSYRQMIGSTTTQVRYILGFTPKVENTSFFSIIYDAFYSTIFNIKIVYVSLYELIRGIVPASQISGPIGIINVIGQAAQAGWVVLLELVALLTVNLGIMNLLPIPALDGGKLLIIIAEAVTKKKLPPEKEGVIQLIGFAFLILIMLFATYNDLIRIFVKT